MFDDKEEAEFHLLSIGLIKGFLFGAREYVYNEGKRVDFVFYFMFIAITWRTEIMTEQQAMDDFINNNP